MVSIIACIGKNREIGLGNELIFHIKKDMEFFKCKTIGERVVMGRKTYESIGKPLANRENIVITSKKIEGVKCVKGIDEIKGNIVVIGGESIYKQYIGKADRLYLTEVDKEGKADRYFPYFDKGKYKRKVLYKGEEEGIKFQIVEYNKVRYNYK